MVDFIWLVEGLIIGVYGSQWVFNGVFKWFYFGVDVGVLIGIDVVVLVGGIIMLVYVDLYYLGGMIIIDYGLGVNLMFLYLSQFNVFVGDRVEQGQKIGEIGVIGCVIGLYLDW